MKRRTIIPALAFAWTLSVSPVAIAQSSSVPFPRDQIALQLGAIQMGYVTNGAPFKPTDQQQAANALAQGRIALATTNGWGTVNVQGAAQPTNYGAQLDAAVLAVLAAPATNSIKGKATLVNGKSQAVTGKLSPPSPEWSVPLPYAISSLTAIGPQGPPGPAGPIGPAGAGVGGVNPTLGGINAFVGGGQDNDALASWATVAGGGFNSASSVFSTVGGGATNVASALYAVVSGGWSNRAYGQGATVSGGQGNSAGTNDTVSGGSDNNSTGGHSTIGGGFRNAAVGPFSFIGGGAYNSANSDGGTIGGGSHNISGNTAVVGGGMSNLAVGQASAILGGFNNRADGSFAAINGGYNNVASGRGAFAAGTFARATNLGSFVWGGSEEFFTDSFADRTFTVRAPGGARFYSTDGFFIGPRLAAGGSDWVANSDSNLKTKVTAVDPREILLKLSRLPVTEWEYKHNPNRRYIGPMAQDFHALFGLGEDDKGIGTLDSDGVMYAAIQGLVEELKERDQQMADRDAKIGELEARSAEIDALKAKIEAMEECLNSLPPAP